MIGHPRVRAYLLEMREKAAEGRAVGEQNGKVIETEAAPPRHRSRAAQLMQLDEQPLVAMCSEHCHSTSLFDDTQPDHALIVSDRPLQVSNLEPHATEVGGRGQPIVRCGDAVVDARGLRRRGHQYSGL